MNKNTAITSSSSDKEHHSCGKTTFFLLAWHILDSTSVKKIHTHTHKGWYIRKITGQIHEPYIMSSESLIHLNECHYQKIPNILHYEPQQLDFCVA